MGDLNLVSDTDLSDDVLNRRMDVATGIKNVLRSIPVTVDEDASSIFVKFQEILVCGVLVNESDYDIFKVSSAWAKETSYLCRESENGDGTWHYYVDTADEVIGEVKRLFMFESKNSKKSLLSFEEQVRKAGLQFESGWSDDPRSKFETVLKPLIENTEYYFKYNETDSTKHILEICKDGEKGRVVGFHKKSKKEPMTIRAFMNRELYNRLRNQVDGIPDNELSSKTQPHISVDLETFWNMICAMTGKNSLRTK